MTRAEARGAGNAQHLMRVDGGATPTAATAETLAQCHAIRHAVFVLGQAVPEHLEWDGLDEQAEHFLVCRTDVDPPRPLGTARLRIVDGVGKAERVAVLDEARGLGLGRLLMKAIADRARELGLREIRLNAQVAVIPFYEKLGYRAEGELFEEAGIDHRAMRRRLS